MSARALVEKLEEFPDYIHFFVTGIENIPSKF